MQMQIWTQYGNGNGLVTMTGIRNTLGDMLALQGVRNVDRYFQPINPEIEQQLIQEQQQMASENPELTEADALVQAEKDGSITREEIEFRIMQLKGERNSLKNAKKKSIEAKYAKLNHMSKKKTSREHDSIDIGKSKKR